MNAIQKLQTAVEKAVNRQAAKIAEDTLAELLLEIRVEFSELSEWEKQFSVVLRAIEVAKAQAEITADEAVEAVEAIKTARLEALDLNG